MVGARFKHRTDLDSRLKHYNQIYQVESCVDPRYIYGVSDGKMAVLTCEGMIMWDFFKTEEEVRKIKEPFRSEILSIYEDVKANNDIIYSKRTWR